MGRLIFNSSMGIIGARGKIARKAAFRDGQGLIQVFGGAYSRMDRRGTANVLCMLPDFSGYEPSAAQTATRNKFRQCIEEVKTILQDPTQTAAYTAAWKKTNPTAVDAKYPTLRGYIFAQVWSTL